MFQPNPDIVWVGTGEAATGRARRGATASTSRPTAAGLDSTWASRTRITSAASSSIPTNPDIVYVAALGHLWGPNQERGLYKTIDGGKTWTNVALHRRRHRRHRRRASIPRTRTCCTRRRISAGARACGFHGGGPGSALYKSIDGGETWTKLTTGLPDGDTGRIGIAIYRKDPRIVYVCDRAGLRYNASTAYDRAPAGVYRSDDKGETWQHMSDWNPRPIYASQIRVDPNDDQRVYMVNSFSYSDDGGKTFKVPRQSLHGDDRMVWIDPRDSRHLIKGDDGGVGISYDRGIDVALRARRCPSASSTASLSTCGSRSGSTAACRTTAAGRAERHLRRARACSTSTGSVPAAAMAFYSARRSADNRTVYSSSQYLGLPAST